MQAYSELTWEHTSIMNSQINYDLAIFDRFLTYMNGKKVLKGYSETHYTVKEAGLAIRSHADLIYLENDKIHAMIISYKKSERGPKGKSISTRTDGDLELLINKAALEEIYPGIIVEHAYLKHKDDNKSVEPFRKTGTKDTNLTELDNTLFSKDGFFDEGKLKTLVENVLNDKDTFYECNSCPANGFCKSETLLQAKEEASILTSKFANSNKKDTHLTKEHMLVANDHTTNMVVCAVQGSGKTATLVSRVHSLIDSGIPGPLILCICYTRNAAEEMYLRINQKVTDPEDGDGLNFNCGYKTMLCKIKSLLHDFKKYGKQEFYHLHPDVSANFAEFYEVYEAAVENGKYATYDGFIEYVVKILTENKMIRKKYAMSFRYIMVDEAQAMDLLQFKFIQLLYSGIGNLCLFGDDDQEIFTWRGSSAQNMIQFMKSGHFEIRKLTKNFRIKGDEGSICK